MADAEKPAKKSDLGVRTASAIVMVAVAGTALWLGGWWWAAFVTLVALGVLFEWVGLVRGGVRTPAARGLWNAMGFVYVALAAVVLLFLRDGLFGLSSVLTVAGAVIATDIGAYFTGRTFGGPKIAPRISPSKTWSGLAGGMAAAVAVLVACGDGNAVFEKVLGGMLLAVVAQAGDFFESWMKRRAGVKDSGKLIPGHGGLFDRVDGLLAVLCVVGGIMIATGLLRIP